MAVSRWMMTEMGLKCVVQVGLEDYVWDKCR
jgi:hypothetical protein